MKMFRSTGTWLATLMLAYVLMSLPSTVQAASADTGPFVVNFADTPATLDSSWACTCPDLILANFYSRLTEYGTKPGPHGTTRIGTGNIVLSFAEPINISDDGLVYTVKLPQGATFPSGSPVESAAVGYSFEHTINMGGCGPCFILDGFCESPLVSSIEPPDSTTLTVTLGRTDPDVLQLRAQPAAPIPDRNERHALHDEITRMWGAESPRVYLHAMDAVSVLTRRVLDDHFLHEVDFRRWG